MGADIMSLKDFLKKVCSEQKKIICFGTGVMAENALKYKEISDAAILFIDNDRNLQGRKVYIGGKCYSVVKLEDAIKHIDNQTIILLTSGYYKEMAKQINNIDLLKNVEVYSFPELRVSYSADSDEFFEERILKECLKEYDIVLDQYRISDEERQKRIEDKKKYILGVDKDSRPLVLPRIMIMPTTRCNLRCKGCSSLLPYFDSPEDVPVEKIIEDSDIFFSGIEECIRLTVGGEPFLYPQLSELLSYLIEQRKILGIMLITNSMIMPNSDVMELLKNPKIFVEISDYGQLEKMGRLISAFETNNVNFSVLSEQKWSDMGGIECRNRSSEELRFSYMNCEQSRIIKGIHNGKFYTCARGARMYAMGAYTSDKDYFELNKNLSNGELKKKIKDMYYNESADACNYCDLGSLPTRVIEAGVQPHGNLTKSAYTIVKREEYEKLKQLERLSGESYD